MLEDSVKAGVERKALKKQQIIRYSQYYAVHIGIHCNRSPAPLHLPFQFFSHHYHSDITGSQTAHRSLCRSLFLAQYERWPLGLS